MAAKYLIRNQPCYACPIGCGRVNKLPTVGVTEGPEYESTWALGANLGINDLASIIEANHLYLIQYPREEPLQRPWSSTRKAS